MAGSIWRGRRLMRSPGNSRAALQHPPMTSVKPSDDVEFDSEVPLLIIGAGAAGLCAALAAHEVGVDPVGVDRTFRGSHPGGGHALPAREGNRGFTEALRAGHRAQIAR